MQSDSVVIPWSHGEFTILNDGAMCAPANFKLDDGRTVQPFAIAPWEEDGSQQFHDLPPLLKRLRGEWPCVPFGMPDVRSDLPPDWMPVSPLPLSLGNSFHGPGSNIRWLENAGFDSGVSLEAVYPQTHPIARLVRRVTGCASGPRLNFELEVHPRQDCALPVGVHPTFRLPEQPGSAVLQIEGEGSVYTYPVELEPGVSKLPAGARFSSLQSAHWADGTAVDLSRHPLDVKTEELVLVSGVSGRATLDNLAENYRVIIHWEPQAFASCAVWISNGGRAYYPWNARFRGIGIEMVSAPFDLGVAVANRGGTPLHAAGVPCVVEFEAGKIWKTSYSIEVAPL